MSAATTIPHTATQTKVVQARNVSKVFKRDAFEVKALDDVSIEIGGGEFMALMGPSGSGKTTLLNMIAAIDRPTGGRAAGAGREHFPLQRFPIGALAQRAYRLRVSDVQSDPGADRVRERRAASAADQALRATAARPRDDRAETGGPGRTRRPSAQAALRRTGTTRRHCPRHRQRSDACCSRTNLPAISTATPRPKCSKS